MNFYSRIRENSGDSLEFTLQRASEDTLKRELQPTKMLHIVALRAYLGGVKK